MGLQRGHLRSKSPHRIPCLSSAMSTSQCSRGPWPSGAGHGGGVLSQFHQAVPPRPFKDHSLQNSNQPHLFLLTALIILPLYTLSFLILLTPNLLWIPILLLCFPHVLQLLFHPSAPITWYSEKTVVHRASSQYSSISLLTLPACFTSFTTVSINTCLVQFNFSLQVWYPLQQHEGM